MKTINNTKSSVRSLLVALVILLLVPATITEAKGKIYFSSEDEQLKTVSVDMLKSDFTLSDEMFVTIVLSDPLQEAYKKHNLVYDFENARYDYNYAIRIFVDDDLKARWLYEMPPEAFKNQRTISFALATESKDLKREFSTVVNNWVNIISELSPGNHKVKFDVIPLNTEVEGEQLPELASGTINLSVDENNKATFVKEAPTDLPLVTMIAPEVEKKIVSASTLDDDSAPARAFITDVKGDWTYVKDDNGNILYRHIIASVLYKQRDGDCWVRSAWYMQRHQGNNQWGPMSFSKPTEGYHNYQVPCDILSN